MAVVPQVKDFVMERTVTEGAGDIVLAGSPSARFRTWRSAFADGATVYYAMAQDGVGFEIGEGTLVYGATDTIQRDTILASSNGGLAVEWGAGTKVIYSTYPSKAVQENIGAGRFWGVAAVEGNSIAAEVFVAAYDSNLVFVGDSGSNDFAGEELKIAEWDPDTSTWANFYDVFDGDMIYDHDAKLWHVGTADGDDGLIDRYSRLTPARLSPQTVTISMNMNAIDRYVPEEAVLVNSGTAKTITLPPIGSGNDGHRVTIKNIGAGAVTVDTDGSENIDGSATYGTMAQYEFATFLLEEDEWWVVAAG